MSKINLLPPQIKENIRFAKKNGKLLSRLMLIVFLGIGTFALSGAGLLLALKRVSDLEREIAAKQKDEQSVRVVKIQGVETDVEKESTRLERRINAIKKIEGDQIFWSLLIQEVSTITPDSVYLRSLPISLRGENRFSISGFAVEQLDIARFRNTLDNSKLFKNVDIENISSSRDSTIGKSGYTFSMSLGLENLDQIRGTGAKI